MIVHLPSGRRVRVRAEQWATATTLADFCPQRAEHTPPANPRRYEATVHAVCGLAVIWRRKRRSRRG
jgi:hypothetical protein